jgi:hypothetical protein
MTNRDDIPTSVLNSNTLPIGDAKQPNDVRLLVARDRARLFVKQARFIGSVSCRKYVLISSFHDFMDAYQ